MKKIIVITLVIAATIGFAQFDYNTGTTAMPLLKIGFGPRTAAMGNAYMGLSTDITGLWWNPAGLNQMNTYEAMLSHHEWLRGIRDEFAAIVWPQSPKNTFGFALNFSSAGGIEYWDENNIPGAGADSIIMAYNAMFVGSYTRQLGKRTGVSASLKGVYESLYSSSGFGGVADFGFHWKASETFALGLTLQNLGPGVFYGGQMYPVPMQARVGASYSMPDLMYGANFLADVCVHMDNNVSVHAGAELWPVDILAARIGFQSGPQTLSELNAISGITAGVGLLLDQYRIDYALAPYAQLGFTHRIAVITAFGERPRYGDVIVKVIDAETSEPLPAQIKVTGLVKTEKGLDESGIWERKGLNPGKLSASATLDDYYPASGETQVKAAQTAELIISMAKIPPGIIEGQVFDVKTGLPLKATVEYQGPQGVKGEIQTDDEGNYRIPDLYRGYYTLHAKPDHPKYFPQDAEVEVQPKGETEKDFALLREKEVIVFHNIQFETGNAEILSQYYTVLDEIGKILVDNPSISVELGGHTDPRPIKTPEFPDNTALSKGRVESVKAYLVEKYGLKPDRLETVGYGETKPVASNDTPEGMAKNRRVEFKVLTGIEYYHEIRNVQTIKPNKTDEPPQEPEGNE